MSPVVFIVCINAFMCHHLSVYKLTESTRTDVTISVFYLFTVSQPNFQEINYVTIHIAMANLKSICRDERQYLGIENKEQRMVRSGLSSPLQHILYVQELKGIETETFTYREMRVTRSKDRHKLRWSWITNVCVWICMRSWKEKWEQCMVKVQSELHNSWVHSDSSDSRKFSSAACVSDSTPTSMDPYLCLRRMCRGDEWVKWGRLSTLRAWSLSSSWATSLPQACAILFPATRLPTIMEAGPTSVQQNHIQ